MKILTGLINQKKKNIRPAEHYVSYRFAFFIFEFSLSFFSLSLHLCLFSSLSLSLFSSVSFRDCLNLSLSPAHLSSHVCLSSHVSLSPHVSPSLLISSCMSLFLLSLFILSAVQ